jgi:hypothetical protein
MSLADAEISENDVQNLLNVNAARYSLYTPAGQTKLLCREFYHLFIVEISLQGFLTVLETLSMSLASHHRLLERSTLKTVCNRSEREVKG